MVGVQCFQLGKNLGSHGFGIADIGYNQPKTLPYPTENPWG